MMGYYQNGWNWVAVVVMMAFMFLFMAGVVAVIAYAIRRAWGDRTPTRRVARLRIAH